METFLQDLRYGARNLLKSRAFTIVAVLTLALGIGANTAVFSTINAFLLRPLPVRDPYRLMAIFARSEGASGGRQFSYLDYKDIQQQTKGFSDILGYRVDLVGIGDGHNAQQAIVSMVTSNFFPALGIRPELGQFFSGEQVEKADADPVVVLGYSYWKQRFNGDPAIVGKTIKVDGRELTVLGVAPKNFTGLYSLIEMQAYMPLGMSTLSYGNQDLWAKRDIRDMRLLGYLAPGVSQKQAKASLALVGSRLAEQYPATNRGIRIATVPETHSRPDPQEDGSMFIIAALFLALAALVLLLACTNIANLLLVRATVRRREMAVRAALGAGRGRLVRQLLTESVLLAIIGGIAGIILGEAAISAVGSIKIDAAFPFHFDFSLDWRVFAYACAAAILTGIVVGLAPALRISRISVAEVLHDGSRGASAGAARSHMRNSFVVAQIAASFVLLVVAGLFVRSLQNAEHLYLGFDPNGVVNVGMDPHLVGYDEAKGREFYRDLEDRVRSLPGVQAVTTASMVPFGYYSDDARVYVQGAAIDDKHPPRQITYNRVDPAYFDVLRVPVLRGRVFTDADNQKAQLVAIVNQAMAERLWPNQDAIGKHFSTKGPGGPWMEVVGVVATGKYFGPAEDPLPLFYTSAAQDYNSLRILQVRTNGSTDALIPELEAQIRQLAPDIPVFDVQPMSQALNTGNGFLLYRVGVGFTMSLGLLGLALAVVGVYGVLAYATAQRTQEIGIRLALGAAREDILRMVLRQGFVVISVGIVLGATLSFAAAGLFRNVLLGTHRFEAVIPVIVAALLTGIALLASYVPARKAMRLDPIIALRHE